MPYENMGACDTHRINASVKGQNWGSIVACEWWASKCSRWKLMLNWWVHGSGTKWWTSDYYFILFYFIFIFCGAWYGRLDIEKQHLKFFGDSCIFEGCHFDNITSKGATIKNSHAQPTRRMHNHHWKVIICHLEYAACTRGAREMEWYGRSSRT